MFFDWKKFCDQRRIPYVTRGPNTARGHISVRCPFCGQQDPSQHMGLSLDPRDPVWGCLRNSNHRGRSPVHLIRLLAGIGEAEAQRLVSSSAPELDQFENLAAKLLHKEPGGARLTPRVTQPLIFPKDLRKLTVHGYGRRFLDYLRSRGLEPAQNVADHYGLMYALTGPFKWRLIIPFWHLGRLVGWTGRAIGRSSLRYLTLPSDAEAAKKLGVPQATTDPDEYVWRQDDVCRPVEVAFERALVIVEGPVDVLKVDWSMRSIERQIVTTCVFGTPKPKQELLLANAARYFDRVVVLLDRDAYGSAYKLAQHIEELSSTKAVAVEPKKKDPGAMNLEEIARALESGLG